MSPRDEDRSARRVMGDQSAKIAAQLMKLRPAVLAKVELDEHLREEIERARAIASHVARRRAERTLAGDLRRHDLRAIAAAIAKAEGTDDSSTQQFHLAERWRTRLIDEGATALAEFPGGSDAKLPDLIDAAQRERATGLPRGAARALFRYLIERLKAAGA